MKQKKVPNLVGTYFQFVWRLVYCFRDSMKSTSALSVTSKPVCAPLGQCVNDYLHHVNEN
jgi:hypothetical protein